MRYTWTGEIPSLRNPVLLAAFAGWSDAAGAATAAARMLIGKWDARQFAEIDGEEFYDFTSARPLVRVGADFQRELEWPRNSFYYHVDPSTERDAAVLVGVEPHLKWRTFTGEILELARQCNVGLVVTLGAMITDTPHTRPVPQIGFATDPGLVERLRDLHVGPTRYQGPTGILGAIHDACLRQEMPAVSLWASVPHYLGVAENPKVAATLLHTIDDLLALRLDLEDLDQAVRRFETQVDAIVAQSPEAAAYVRELETRADAAEETETGDDETELPPSGALIKDLEEFLKRRRAQGGNGDES